MTKQASVIGSGPNGLAAAVRMAQAGYRVTVYEAQPSYGGGCRTFAPTLPGFLHDHCSAIHPLGIGSPYFRTLPLAQHGLHWIHPDTPLAHPLDDGTAAVLERSPAATAHSLGADSNAYLRLIMPLLPDWEQVCRILRHPLRMALRPAGLARFGLPALDSAQNLADRHFRDPHARALIAGLAAHSFLPMDNRPSAAFALVLALLAHAVGWPFPRGGSQKIADALAGVLLDLGGEIITNHPIDTLDGLTDGPLFADIGVPQLLNLTEGRLSAGYKRQLEKFKPGPSIFKIDYALDAPVPWTASGCRHAGTVHLGGTLEEIAAGEAQVARGIAPDAPFVLVAQQSLFDPTRAPNGKHTLWAYCHIPLGSTVDMTPRIEAQIERFAPGFSQRILARHITTPADQERQNASMPLGDITGGAYTLAQMIARPVLSANPWQTGVPNLYLCSASTPPGGGVHGLCGYYAAQSALGKLYSW